MHQNRFLYFIRESFRGFIWTVLIAAGLAMIIIVILTRKTDDEGPMRCLNTTLKYNLNFIAPTQIGIEKWKIGDYARYRHQRKKSISDEAVDREVAFHIIAELEKSGTHGHWMRKSGFEFNLNIPRDIYRFLTVNDLRITAEYPKFIYTHNYIPIRLTSCEQETTPLAKLIKLGETEIETQAGTLECIHYRVEIGTGRDQKVLEIWASPAILPLGIVRARSETESLDLISFGQNPEVSVPRLFQPVVEGISELKHGCSSCHGEGCHAMFFPPK